DVAELAQGIARRQRFFHWRLAFPQVFEREQGGFDVVLGNPPWEMLQFDPQEFFASRAPQIASAQHMAARDRLIEELAITNPTLYQEFETARDAVLRGQAFVHGSGRYPYTSHGRINLAPLFAEMTTQLHGATGRAGLIVPSGIATDSFTQYFFRHLIEDKRLTSLYDFENRQKIFASVDSRMKFSLLTLGQGAEVAQLQFFAYGVNDLADEKRRFTLSPEEFTLPNPHAMTCPVFRSQADAELTKKFYRRAGVFIREARDDQPEVNPWGINFMLMFMMNTASHLFRTYNELMGQGGVLTGNVITLHGT